MEGKMFQVLLDVLVPLVLGYVSRRKGWMGEHGCRVLMLVNVIGLLTTMNLLSFWLLPIDSSLIYIPILSLVAALVGGALAAKFFARNLPDLLQQGSYVLTAMLSNIGTMAGLAGYFLFGEISYAYIQLFATPQNVLMVVFAFPLAQYYRARYLQQQEGVHFELHFREMFLTPKQLGSVGMVVGLWLHWAGVPRPAVLADSFPVLIHARAWIALLPVGYKLDFGKARKYYRRILTLLPLKFILVPAVIYALARLHFSDPVLLGTLLVASSAPSAINAVITSTLFQLDADLSVAAFILTTSAYILVVIPAFFLFFHIVAGL